MFYHVFQPIEHMMFLLCLWKAFHLQIHAKTQTYSKDMADSQATQNDEEKAKNASKISAK